VLVVSNQLIDNKTIFPLELNTMPGWAGSSWYWMRYMDAHNEAEFASQEALKYWENVDLYIGGSEHATGHLLYSRFWNKFLKDKGYAPTEEPFKKLINQGMIVGQSFFTYVDFENKLIYPNHHLTSGTHNLTPVRIPYAEKFFKSHGDLDISKKDLFLKEIKCEGFKLVGIDIKSTNVNSELPFDFEMLIEKMSKSKFNVVNPDDIVEQYGADTLRLYEMFLGPLEQAKPWNTAGITGVSGFLKKLWRLYFDENTGLNVSEEEPTAEMYKSLNKTIKKVTEDIENFSFNTSVSQFMICVNELAQMKCNHRAILEPLAILISPYAPHIAEELWSQLGHSGSISTVAFPICNEKYLVESEKEYPVSFNGKMRFTIKLPLDLTVPQIQEIIMADERTIKQLDGKTPSKVIIVPGKVINLVG
jgi:leucyl-tRNA synthetase